MLKKQTNEKLRAMRLDAMAAAWSEQNGKPEVASLSFDERFGMLVDAEWTHRQSNCLATAVREATPARASLAVVERPSEADALRLADAELHPALACAALAGFEHPEQDERRLQAARDALLRAARENIGRCGVKEAQKMVRVEMFREAFRLENGNRHAVARLLEVDRRYVLKVLKENGGFIKR
jgi:DNA-binding NtrC family response regulator